MSESPCLSLCARWEHNTPMTQQDMVQDQVTSSAAAVWYSVYGSVQVAVYETEEEAASFALDIEEEGSGSVSGVQFPDGRFVDWDAWVTVHRLSEERSEVSHREFAEMASRPRPATRQVQPPFDTRRGRPVEVPADAPTWLGRGAERHE